MATETGLPTGEQIIEGLLRNGRTESELLGFLSLLNKGVKENEIRTEISCWDHVVGFFEMASRRFVRDDSTLILKDAELGMHEANCQSPICTKLTQIYFSFLRGSDAKDSEKIEDHLRCLATEILTGKVCPNFEGKRSIFYDSQTGDDLFVTKAVEITDKLIKDRLIVADVVLMYIPTSTQLLVDVHEMKNGETLVQQAFELTQKPLFTDEGFKLRASIIGIDPKLFNAIIVANKPQVSFPH